ncbi:MAG TPA: hypothetical protein VKJ47_10955 [Candidatus Binatia bacterium]|nr:hypothetical protein [Candidatus Binatia bacterium]
MVTIEMFLEAEGGLSPQAFVEQYAEILGLQRPGRLEVKPGASVWRFLDLCLYALMKTNGTGYVEGAMSRATEVCCQSFAKGTMQCFQCPFRSGETPALRRFYQEARGKALALDTDGNRSYGP